MHRHMAIGHVVSPAGGEEFLEEVCLTTCPASARARLCAARQQQHSMPRSWPSASDETGVAAADVFVALLRSPMAPCSQQQKSKKARDSARSTVRKRLRPTISANSGETAPFELKAQHPALALLTQFKPAQHYLLRTRVSTSCLHQLLRQAALYRWAETPSQ